MKNKLLKFASVFSLSAFFPMLVLAQNGGCFADFQGDKKLGGMFLYLTCIIRDTVIPLLFAIAIVAFVWGVVKFIAHSEDEAKRESGKQLMIWGIVGLTVMLGVWGLVGIVGGTFGFETRVLPSVSPTVSP